MTPAETLLDRLEGVRPTGEGKHQALCPAHEDRTPSLAVTEKDDGGVLLHCHAGCAAGDVIAAADLTWPDLLPERDGPRELAAAYDYQDAAGGLAFQVVRFAPKDFRQRRPDGNGGWVWNLKGVERVLYRLPRVLAGVERGETIFVTEGEKDVLALEQHGLVATCNPGGAGKWREPYSKCLAGADVVVVADRDEPGRKHAAAVAESLRGIAADVDVVEPTKGKDMAAHLAAGGRPLEVADVTSTLASAEEPTAPTRPPVAVPETREILDEVQGLIAKYVVLPSEHEAVALTLWVAHSWAPDGAHATPYLLVTSPERRSGKTRLLEVLELVVRTPWRIASASEAAMFRKISDHQPTLLLDEIDAIFGSATERTEPLRAVLNAGNRPGSAVARCVGDGANQTVVDFSVYCPKVLAGIDTGRVPDTIVDRSIRLAMKRKTGNEPTASLRHRHADREAQPIRDGLQAWGEANAPELLEAEPANIPAALDDRAAEAWEPLFAIADMAGGKAPAEARAAAVALIGEDSDEPGHGARLLAALRTVFGDQDALATTTILEKINADEELPFGGWRHGDGLDPRGLARLLKPYGVKRRTIRLGDTTAKGYRRDQLEEPWARYLPPTPESGSQGEHRSQPAPRLERDVTPVTDVTDFPGGVEAAA